MPVLYLVEQGASLKKDGDTLLVTKDKEVLQKIPATKVEQVVLFGNVNVSTPVVHFLLENGIDCVFCSSHGKYFGRLVSTESRFGLLRQAQLRAASKPETRLAVAQMIVSAKLANQRTLLMRYLRESELPDLIAAVEGLKVGMDKIGRAQDLGTVLGTEGYCGALYFAAMRSVLKQDLGFRARVRRPPRDPVNSLLSLGYTLLANAAQASVRTVGLDAFIGFLHATEYSRPSLALDLMEEFRPLIVDSIVLRVVNNRILTEADFEVGADQGGMVRLKPEALKTYLGQFEERMQTVVIHPRTGTKVDYRRCLDLQARQLTRVISGQETEYQPFLAK